MSDPHWLLQELAGEAVWAVLIGGSVWAWQKRNAITRAITRRPVYKDATVRAYIGSSGIASADAITAGDRESVGLTESGTATLTRGPARPQLKRVADELLELGLWYLRLS